MGIYEKLIKAQNDLNVPKERYNEFGGYYFRNCSDIMQAAKPVLSKYDLVLTVTDEVLYLGNRYYIKATATISDGEDKISVSAVAREQKERKKMDDSQLTGAASSYARKYALNGLFALDDNPDADSLNKHEDEDESNNKSYSKKKNYSNNSYSKKKSYSKTGNSNKQKNEVKKKRQLNEKKKLINDIYTFYKGNEKIIGNTMSDFLEEKGFDPSDYKELKKLTISQLKTLDKKVQYQIKGA